MQRRTEAGRKDERNRLVLAGKLISLPEFAEVWACSSVHSGVSGVTVDGLQALYCFRLEVCLEVWDRSANQPAGSLGDLGQSSLVLFFEAAEVTEAVECHHRLHCGLVKQLLQLRADTARLQLLHEVKPLVALF